MQGQAPAGHCGAQGRKMPLEARRLRASAAPGVIKGAARHAMPQEAKHSRASAAPRAIRRPWAAIEGHRRP